jgi:c-di-GMP-binding flagellar brake protein YcgR
MDAPEMPATERRKSSRFPIEREIRYKTLNQRTELQTGVGKTLNISSSGVLFTSEHDMPLGTRLEVAISWPAQLNDKCLLNLVARGRVTRHAKGQLALQIQQYEFRTQSIPGTR